MKPEFPTHLTDPELLSEVKHFAHCEREATAQLVAHLAELDSRRLYLAAGFSSLFTYCCDVLGLSESEAYNRIEAARAARRFPVLLSLLASASLNLTTVRLLAPHLTPDNHRDLIAAAKGRTKRGVEELLAGRFPRPDLPGSIRRLPPARPSREPGSAPGDGPESGARSPLPAVPDAAGTESRPGTGGHDANPDSTEAPAVDGLLTASTAGTQPGRSRSSVSPTAADRYQIRFTATGETCAKLRQVQDLLRHAVPTGDLAQVFDRALSALLAELSRKKAGVVNRPRSRPAAAKAGSRQVPAAVRRAVWARDRGQCAFVSRSGRRCSERGRLEFHHVRPFAVGGPAIAANIQLRCRAHNAHEASLFFGPMRKEEMSAAQHGKASPLASPGSGATRSGTSPSTQRLTAPGSGA